MSTPQERELNDRKLEFIINEAAGGNMEAAEYLALLAAWARVTDDVYDEYENVSRNNALTAIEIAFVRIPNNKFFKQHQETLTSQHLSLWNAWEGSNVLNKGDETDKIYAHVLRDYINEILPVVACLTQGYTKMKEVNIQIRQLFKKELGD